MIKLTFLVSGNKFGVFVKDILSVEDQSEGYTKLITRQNDIYKCREKVSEIVKIINSLGDK